MSDDLSELDRIIRAQAARIAVLEGLLRECIACWNKVNAELAAEQLRCKVAEERRDALSGELAAERAAREAAESKAQVMHDLHDALGVRWGADPYARIDALKQAERDAALAQAVQEKCAEVALNCPREESEIPITGNPMYDVHYAYARGGNVMSRDIREAIRSLQLSDSARRLFEDAGAAADLAREETIKLAIAFFDQPLYPMVREPLKAALEKHLRSTITDPESVRRTLEDAERFQSLPKWMSAICWNTASNLPPLGHLKHGFSLDDLRAWLDDANAARKSEDWSVIMTHFDETFCRACGQTYPNCTCSGREAAFRQGVQLGKVEAQQQIERAERERDAAADLAKEECEDFQHNAMSDYVGLGLHSPESTPSDNCDRA